MIHMQPGDAFVASTPGLLEFKASQAPLLSKAAGAGVVSKGGVAMGQTLSMASSGATAQSLPASLISGKVLGFSLSAVNPWILLGVGAAAGYWYFKKRRYSLF
ncbi:MAG: hypothetical protein H7832_02360 [Magnetococcus sp. DMHC-6]